MRWITPGGTKTEHIVAKTAPSTTSVSPTEPPDGAAAPDESLQTSERNAGWRLIWWTIKKERAGLAIGIAVAICWTMARIAIPWLISQGIDDGIVGGGSLLTWAGLIVLAGAVSAVLTGARRYSAFRTARSGERRLRDRIFAHVQRLHFAFHDSVQTGDLMSRSGTDLQHFQNFLTMLPVTTGNAVVVTAVTIILFSTNAELALLALIFLPFLQYLGRKFGKTVHPALMAIQKESADLAAVVEETVAGIRVIKGFGAEQGRADLLSQEADDVYTQSIRTARIRSHFWPAIELLPSLGLVVVLWRGGQLVLNDELTIGELVSFNIYVTMLVQPVRMLGMIIASAQRASAAGRRIGAVLARAPQITDPAHPKHLPPDGVGPDPVGRVEFRHVEFSYPDEPEIPVLHDLSFTFEPGETVAIVGATGSGKSTVARLLPRFYDVTGGEILIDGIDIRSLRLSELRPQVGIVFEETFLFSDSVHANIGFADPDAPKERVTQAATLAGAHDFIQELEDGYDTVLGERGYSLSGGQRQRVAIARAVLANPRIVILDDATSAVDPNTEHEIRDALAEVMGRRTTVVIAHRPATVALADRVILIDHGRAIAEGTHQELLETNERYREVLAAGTADANPDGEEA